MRLKIEAERGRLKSPWDYRSALTAKIHEILAVLDLRHEYVLVRRRICPRNKFAVA